MCQKNIYGTFKTGKALKVLKLERKWRDVLRLYEGRPYLPGKALWAKPAHHSWADLENTERWEEWKVNNHRMRLGIPRVKLGGKTGSFVNDFDTDHGILISLTLLEHKMYISGKIS